MAKPDFRKRVVNQMFGELEQKYLAERKAECEKLHNRLVEVIGEEEASPQNTLLVLEVLKAEILNDCLEKFFKPTVGLSDKEIKPLEAEK